MHLHRQPHYTRASGRQLARWQKCLTRASRAPPSQRSLKAFLCPTGLPHSKLANEENMAPGLHRRTPLPASTRRHPKKVERTTNRRHPKKVERTTNRRHPKKVERTTNRRHPKKVERTTNRRHPKKVERTTNQRHRRHQICTAQIMIVPGSAREVESRGITSHPREPRGGEAVETTGLALGLRCCHGPTALLAACHGPTPNTFKRVAVQGRLVAEHEVLEFAKVA